MNNKIMKISLKLKTLSVRLMDVFGFLQQFFVIKKSTQSHFCIQLNKKQKTCVSCSHSVQKCHFAVYLEASSCSFFISVANVFSGNLVCRRRAFLFFFPAFFSLFSLENYSLALLVVRISTSFLILLISHFQSWFFVEILFVFNFIIES